MAWGWIECIGNTLEAGWNATVDGVTYAGEQAYNGVKYIGGKTVDGITYAGEQAYNGVKYIGGKTVDGITYAGEQAYNGAKYIGGKTVDFADTTVQYSGQAIQKGTDLISDGMVYTAQVVDKGLNDAGTWIGETAYEYMGDKVPHTNINTKNIPYAVEGLIKNPFSSVAQLAGGITESTGDMINHMTSEGFVRLPRKMLGETYDFFAKNTVVNLIASNINGPEKLTTQTFVNEIEDPIFVAYYPAGQAKVSQGHVAMWYRGLKVDVAPVFDNPHSVMSGDMIYGEVCEKPMFDTSSGKDVCYIYMLDPKDIGMKTEEDCQRVLNRMERGINNTRGKDNNLSKDYYHGLTNNCVSSVLKSLDGYVNDTGIDSPYTLSNTLSELVDKGKAHRLSVDTFNQYVANRWEKKLIQQEEKSINKTNLWENAFLSDDKLQAFFERNPDLEKEFMQSRKLSPFDTPAKNMDYKREFLLRKNQQITDIIDASVKDIEMLFKNKPELEKEFRQGRKSSSMDSQSDVFHHRKRFLIEKEVKQQYSGDVKDIKLDFLMFQDDISDAVKLERNDVLNTLNKCAVIIEKQQIPSLSVDKLTHKVENNEEMILSHFSDKQYSK